MFNQLDLVPSYGKDYKAAQTVREAFEANQDFLLYGTSRYCNKTDILRELAPGGSQELNIRYNNMKKKLILVVKKPLASKGTEFQVGDL